MNEHTQRAHEQRRADRWDEPTCPECAELVAADTARFNAEHQEFLSEFGPWLR